LRIVFVLPLADLSGGIRTVAIYARALQQRGHRVTVISTGRWIPPLSSRLKGLLLGRGWWRPEPPGPAHLDGLGVEHRRLARFGPVVDRDVPDADVVVATWWVTAEWVAGLSRRKGAKVHLIQGNDADTPDMPLDRIEATWRLPLHRIVVSGWLEELARRRGAADVACVPNGVDTRLFDGPPRGKQADPTVGYVHSDLALKGCDIALAACRQVRGHRPSLRLRVFGSLPASGHLALPPGAEFRLRPDQADIPGIYAGCDAWLWPSRSEGFGLPILEAMACRTPVIAAPAGAAPDLLAGGGGILLPAAAPEPMAEAIERVCALSDPAWRALSEQARAVAEAHGWERSVTLFEQALEAAASHRAGPG
jgi:glycosyltransferase involved in cell wall biosynthesis